MSSPAGLSPEEQLNFLFKIIGDLLAANQNLVATLAWLVYDILITLDQEIERMWGAPLTLPSFIYFSTRYYGLFFLIWGTATQTNSNLTAKLRELGPLRSRRCTVPIYECKRAASHPNRCILQPQSQSQNFPHLYLLGRIWGGLPSPRPTKYILSTTLQTELAFSSLTGMNSGHAQVHPPGVPLPGCLSSAAPRFGIAAWITNIVYQVLCLALALYKFFAAFGGEVTKSRLADMFIRDGALFFFMIFGANMLNIILAYGIPESALLNLCVPWIIATFAVGAPRIILNLKGAARSSGYTSEFEMHVRTNNESLVFAPPAELSRVNFPSAGQDVELQTIPGHSA
ncbi:hypothetical protein C8J57DRAFT_244221 [Mycena rebaudengoi]|nr:hypothetical protein C8J57DRAFT_244221 [Mycena rebaudengoi]